MLFFLLINVKMPTIVAIVTFMSRKIFMLNWAEHEKKFYNLGASFGQMFYNQSSFYGF